MTRPGKAPRRPARAWRPLARGAAAALALVVAVPVAADEIVSAAYADPTNRYGHRVLGAEGEYDTLVVTLRDGRRIAARWSDPMLFEDTAPRLADLDGDGAPEVIVVESNQSLGARLSVWGLRDGALVLLAHTPHIGQRNRWLAPFAAGDLDGDGRVEIAFVDRPHLARTLRVWRYVPDGGAVRLEPVASLPAVTNHRIGWDYILGGLRDCGAGPEMILSDATWLQLVAVRLSDGVLEARELGMSPDIKGFDAALACEF